jgi:hypothetical protein
MTWHTTPPTPADADPLGLVRWGPRLPGMLIHWTHVRPGEQWCRSAAYQSPIQEDNHD